ncbi:MAG: exonuclease domain-containing protein [Solibacillus sp.]
MCLRQTTQFPTSYVVLDFETTGFSAAHDEPIQVSAIRYEQFQETASFVTFIRPTKPVPANITAFTGITTEDVAHAPTIHDVFAELVNFIGKDAIVAHNASFDLKFLEINMQKVGLPYTKFRVIDTVPLARRYIPAANHKLPPLKSFLNLEQLPSHEAQSDCYVTSAAYQYCHRQKFGY